MAELKRPKRVNTSQPLEDFPMVETGEYIWHITIGNGRRTPPDMPAGELQNLLAHHGFVGLTIGRVVPAAGLQLESIPVSLLDAR